MLVPLPARAAAAAAAAFVVHSAGADSSLLGIPGTWELKETRAGNLCMARAVFTQDPPGADEGRVTVSSPCFDTGSGAWRAVYTGDAPTFGWALDYERSTVLYSASRVEAARPGGTVKARGIIRAAKRSEPNKLAPVGTFEAQAKLPASASR